MDENFLCNFNLAFLILILILISIVSCESVVGCELKGTEPGSVINEFIKNEFDGVVDSRMMFGAYKINGKMLHGGNLNEISMPGVVINLEGDPIKVVLDYKVACISLEGEFAKLVVSFSSIATTNGFGESDRVLVENDKQVDKAEYELQLFDGKWKVVNPPIPRISLDSLISAYKEDVLAMEKIVKIPNSKASETQKKNYSVILREMKKLQSWKNEKG